MRNPTGNQVVWEGKPAAGSSSILALTLTGIRQSCENSRVIRICQRQMPSSILAGPEEPDTNTVPAACMQDKVRYDEVDAVIACRNESRAQLMKGQVPAGLNLSLLPGCGSSFRAKLPVAVNLM
jgi:hypothetical protein